MRRVSQWSVVSSSVFCFALCAMLFGLCVSADAQSAKKVPRIGYLTLRPGPFDHDKIFKQELHDLGWIDGRIARSSIDGRREKWTACPFLQRNSSTLRLT